MEGRAARWFFRLMTLVRAGVPVHPARDRRALRLQQDAARRPGLPTCGRQNGSRRRSAGSHVEAGAVQLDQGGDRGNDPGPLVLGSAGLVRRAPVLVLRPAARSRSPLVLPIALPGIVTAMALQLDGRQRCPSSASALPTIMSGHATFCVVVVYNNVVARLRRTSDSFMEAIDGPGRRRVADVPVRHAAVDAARRCWPAACSRSGCRSTRSS